MLELLSEIKEDHPEKTPDKHDRVLLIDGLNLFFRNFSAINMVNPDGHHIGGLGGFLKSLGAMIKLIQPTSVYVVFDGPGSSDNRKNLIPEYKSGRHTERVTKWETFDDLDEEETSKINQITRVIHYLKSLPLKMSILNKVEADDIISVLCDVLPKKYNSNIFILSSDKDFLQLINNKVTVYRPMERIFYTPQVVEDKFGVKPHNFIIYKTLIGDSSDKIVGVRGLGPKTIFKKFPELKTQKLSLQNIFDISEQKLTNHIIYARILKYQDKLKDSYKIMDLSNPMIDEQGINYVENLIEEDFPPLDKEMVIKMYERDKLGRMIRNLEFWLDEVFARFSKFS